MSGQISTRRPRSGVQSEPAALLDGYGSITPLEPLERALIGDTLAARGALALTISAWRVQRFPENQRYILSWDRNAVHMLGQFEAVGFGEAGRRLAGFARCVANATNRAANVKYSGLPRCVMAA